jgi:hypothetical protein
VSCPSPPLDSATSAQVDVITQVLIGDGTSETSAVEFARAQLELLRIRAIRAELMNEADLKLENPQELRRLVALDRYPADPPRASGPNNVALITI